MSEESARGRFVWHDLMVPDPEAVEDFYKAVMGWGTEIWQGPQPYRMWTAGGTAMSGTMKLPEEAVAGGSQPHWLAYIAVPDVDATAARAQELGGKVLVPPSDIPTVGRYAVLADPQGALFAPFASADPRPPRKGVPPVGEFSWHELITSDAEAALAFYSDLFGWEKVSEYDMGPHGIYHLYGTGGDRLGGMFTQHGRPPAWLHYARVPDVNAAVEAAGKHGGQVILGPMEVPGGDWVAVFSDPQGTPFAVHQVKSA